MKIPQITAVGNRQPLPMPVSLLMSILVALALLTAARPAAAETTATQPIVTQAQVNHAREICAQHKRKVERLEAQNAGDGVLANERAAWEASCAQASDLMNAIGMN